jgi:adenosylhomocysteine nucleosidase
MREIPFYCIKGVSDELTEKLPDLNRFIGANGRFRTGAFVLFSLARPWYWPALIRMGENSRKAAKAISQSLLEFLGAGGHVRNSNANPDLNS